MKISIKFEPRDIWIGVYWDKESYFIPLPLEKWTVVRVYICLIPLFPIKVSWEYGR
jgi:hypothetical protein